MNSRLIHPTKIFLLSLIVSTFSSGVSASTRMDNYLRERLAFFRVVPFPDLVQDQSSVHQARVELGRNLFMDGSLSGNRNISCLFCHHPVMGTSDRLPLSQTHDRQGVLKRNSSSLVNIGAPDHHFMFWDGRVNYNPKSKIFATPEPALNGPNPKAKHITSVLTSAAAAQALFPIVNKDEMMGEKGDNEIANAKDNLEAWDKVMKRLLVDEHFDKKLYVQLFNRSYPGTKDFNIGHVGEAIATFMKVQFHSNQSPFHRYVAGDNSALTNRQKQGLDVFMDKGRCIACHQGNLLELNSFFTSVGVPSIGASPMAEVDRGRGEIDGPSRNYFFRTPSLINVATSAPYMHNGAFRTLREVINHYNNVSHSLQTYEIPSEYQAISPVPLELRNSPEDIQKIWNSIPARFLRTGLGLTDAEKDALEDFLENGLTDPGWRSTRPISF